MDPILVYAAGDLDAAGIPVDRELPPAWLAEHLADVEATAERPGRVSGRLSLSGTDYVVVLTDGRVLTGLLTSDTDAGLTLRRGQGIEDTVPRSLVEEISGTGKSLMPEGLERTITPAEMNDLIAFLLSDATANAATASEPTRRDP